MVKIQNVDPAKLTPADYNPRTISEHQAEALKRSLDRWGFVEPIVANKRTGHIVGGHQRLDGALALALPSVPVHWIDVDESSEKALNIALNKISGDWDEDLLGKLLADLERDGQDLEDLGFDADELQEIIDAAAPEPELSGDLDEVPEPPAEPITQPGDLWQLGEHRLLCGDSTNAEDVARLMGGAKADMVFTDPPYNIGFSGTMSSTSKNGVLMPYITENAKHEAIHNDKKTGKDFEDFITATLSMIRLHCKGAYYISFGSGNLHELLGPVAKSIGYKSIIIWVKNQSPMGGGHYRRRYEPIVYGNFSNDFHGVPYSEDDVWEFDRTKKNDLHPTMKPVNLVRNAISHGTKRDDSVLDFFAGSGTTIIAAEQTGRKCYAMEISPAYCDVAVKRWEQATGRKAERVG